MLRKDMPVKRAIIDSVAWLPQITVMSYFTQTWDPSQKQTNICI